ARASARAADRPPMPPPAMSISPSRAIVKSYPSGSAVRIARGSISRERLAHLVRGDLDLHARALVLQAHGRARIELAPAALERRAEVLVGDARLLHRHAELAR